MTSTLGDVEEINSMIGTSFPYPIAFPYRLLQGMGHVSLRYKEQLRVAENLLAFVACVSLALIHEEDRERADINLRDYWSRGASPGHWLDIVRRSSRVLAGYQHEPLAQAIYELRAADEKKGFGREAIYFVRSLNDWKHHRGPTIEEEFEEKSQEVQDALVKCMTNLSFFKNFPIRQVQDVNVDRVGNIILRCELYVGDHPALGHEDVRYHEPLHKGDLYIDSGAGKWTSLYPFIEAKYCGSCKAREVFVVERWNEREDLVGERSFDRGHARTDKGSLSADLSAWTTPSGIKADSGEPIGPGNLSAQKSSSSTILSDGAVSTVGKAHDIESTPLTPLKQLQLDYWQGLRQELLQHSRLRPSAARPSHIMYFAVGRSGIKLAASMSSRERWVQAQIVFYEKRTDEAWFPLLLAQRDEIDREVGTPLAWDNPHVESIGSGKENRMAIRLDGADIRDRSDWTRQHVWLREKLEALHRVFGPRMKALPSLE